MLVAAGVVDRRHAPLERPPRRVVARSCCRAAYLRGAFLGAGSLSLGRSPHLELRTASRESAALLARLARRRGGRARDRASARAHSLRYAKSWEAIESLLAVMGASETVLALEERAVVAETRSRANRLANADHANLVRTSRSARRQLAAVERLRADDDLDACRIPCARSPSCGCATRRHRCASSRREPSLASTKAAVHRAAPPATARSELAE